MRQWIEVPCTHPGTSVQSQTRANGQSPNHPIAQPLNTVTIIVTIIIIIIYHIATPRGPLQEKLKFKHVRQ